MDYLVKRLASGILSSIMCPTNIPNLIMCWLCKCVVEGVGNFTEYPNRSRRGMLHSLNSRPWHWLQTTVPPIHNPSCQKISILYWVGTKLKKVNELDNFEWYTGSSKKTLLSSVIHVQSGLMGCALVSGWEEGGRFKHARIFLHHTICWIHRTAIIYKHFMFQEKEVQTSPAASYEVFRTVESTPVNSQTSDCL